MKRKKTFLLILAFAVFIYVVFGFVGPFQQERVIHSKISLKAIRNSVLWFKQENGFFPENIGEIERYIEKMNIDRNEMKLNGKHVLFFLPSYHSDRISTSEGNNREYISLNNNGGFYYDRIKGEVRINLTRPLKTYFIVYLGKDRNEIPSSW